jgi:hypothetical protein
VKINEQLLEFMLGCFILVSRQFFHCSQDDLLQMIVGFGKMDILLL